MPLDPEGKAGVRRGLEDYKEGRMTPWSEVKEELNIKDPKPICTCTKAERRRPKGKLGPHKLGCPRKGLD